MNVERRDLLEHALIGFAKQAEQIQAQMDAIRKELRAEKRGNAGKRAGNSGETRGQVHKMSLAGRARIAAAAKKRWKLWKKSQKAA